MDSKNTSLQIIENKGFFAKIVNFFKQLFRKDKQSCIVSNNDINNKENNNNSFFNSIKFEEDPDTSKLLKIQDELEKRGINEVNAFELTKNLSEEQKQKLETLYRDQIKEFEVSLEKFKNKIISIRKKTNDK